MSITAEQGRWLLEQAGTRGFVMAVSGGDQVLVWMRQGIVPVVYDSEEEACEVHELALRLPGCSIEPAVVTPNGVHLLEKACRWEGALDGWCEQTDGV